MTKPKIAYELHGCDYSGKYGIIENPRIGFMRDGIFLGASFGWKGTGGLGVGSVADFAFDVYDKDLGERLPSVAFGYWVRDILKVMNVDSWDQLKGKPVITLWEDESGLGRTCKGISNPANDKFIVWDQWWEEVGRPLMNAEEESR